MTHVDRSHRAIAGQTQSLHVAALNGADQFFSILAVPATSIHRCRSALNDSDTLSLRQLTIFAAFASSAAIQGIDYGDDGNIR